ncbi:MAG: hypothetical protein AB2L26_09040 [Ignavibacteria bacterium]
MKQVLILILSISVATLYNPVFWVSVIGPFFQALHFLWLRSKLGIIYRAKTVAELPEELTSDKEEIDELRRTLNENELFYALSDFNTQLFVTTVAFIFLVLNLINLMSIFLKKFNGEIVAKILYDDIFSLIVLILFLLFVFIGIYVLISGKLISYKILKYYKPEGGIITGETRFPPIQSGLTWFRYLITIYSIFYSYWVNEKVPDLIVKMQALC